jgi:hypothetical protein
MGKLTPGATYIYERNAGEVYAREVGADPSTRKLIGYNWDPVSGKRSTHDHIIEDKMWGEIRRMAPTNPALQKALDRAIMIYRLSKDKPL